MSLRIRIIAAAASALFAFSSVVAAENVSAAGMAAQTASSAAAAEDVSSAAPATAPDTGAGTGAAAPSAADKVPVSAAAGPAEADAGRYLHDGEKAFRRGMDLDQSDPGAAAEQYRRAILDFERIAYQDGIRNGKLFYNIGNAYFRLGDLGRAVLNYKRAAMFAPHDQNLLQNLEYARSRRVNRVETTQREKVFKTLFFLHYDLPPHVRLLLFVTLFALAWTAASVLIFFRRGWLRGLLVFFAAASLFFLGSLAVERYGAARKPEGVITAKEVTARKGDAETYQPSFTDPLHSGTEFRLVEKRTDWWYIELGDGERCWIPAGAGDLVVDWK